MTFCRHAGLLLGALAVAISAAAFWKASLSETAGLGEPTRSESMADDGSFSAPPAPAPVVQSCQGPRLILHVGPGKTGTSALQDFLVKRATWLDEEWGIGVGFRQSKAAAYDLAIPLCEENRVEKDKCEPKQNLGSCSHVLALL